MSFYNQNNIYNYRLSEIGSTFHYHLMHDGHPINKLQNGIILSIFKL